jgi:hypothetical protein
MDHNNPNNKKFDLLRVLAVSAIGWFGLMMIVAIGAGLYIQRELDSSVLEACKDAFGLHVTNLGDSDHPDLLISGFAPESFASIGRISTEDESSTLIVFLHLSLPMLGESPYFHEEVEIPPEIENVQFGLDKTEIWKREAPADATVLCGG